MFKQGKYRRRRANHRRVDRTRHLPERFRDAEKSRAGRDVLRALRRAVAAKRAPRRGFAGVFAGQTVNITLVGTGDHSIPPEGYGGVELVIWNIRNILIDHGHKVNIVNVPGGGNSIPRRWKILRAIHAGRPDVVHLHASKYFNLARFIRCPNIVFSDHSPSVSLAEYEYHRRAKIKGAHTTCFSEKIKKLYAASGIDCNFLHVIPNGVAISEFSFTENPKHPEKSVCLGVISKRKRQYALKAIENIDFAGPIHEEEKFLDGAYQGEWSRKQVQEELTNYASLVLLSKSEVHNLLSFAWKPWQVASGLLFRKPISTTSTLTNHSLM